MNQEQLRKKKTRKELKRKRVIESRIKDHGNKERIKAREVVKKSVKPMEAKLKWWQRLWNWIKSV